MDDNVVATAEFNPRVKTYWLLSGIWVLTITVVGIPLLLLWIPIGLLVTQRFLDSLSCVLTDRSLKVSKGVLNRIEKTVPLDKITDLAVRQGPIMRFLDLEGLSLETAGQSGTGSLVMLVGVKDAKAFRDQVLAQRDRITVRGAEPSAAPAEDAGGSNSDSILEEIRDSMFRIEALLERAPRLKTETDQRPSVR